MLVKSRQELLEWEMCHGVEHLQKQRVNLIVFLVSLLRKVLQKLLYVQVRISNAGAVNELESTRNVQCRKVFRTIV